MDRKPLLFTVTMVLVVGAFIGTLAAGKSPQLGLDLRGGISVRLFPVKGTDPAKLDTARQIISNRVNSLGVAEPEVSRQGDTIVVDLPGVKDRDKALAIIGSTGEMQNREVLSQIPATAKFPSTTTTKPGATTTTKPGSTTTAAGATTSFTGPSKSAGTTTPGASTTTVAGATTTAAGATTTAAGATTTAAGATTTVAGATTTTKPGPTTTTEDLAGKTCADIVDNVTVFFDQINSQRKKHEYCFELGPNLLSGTAVSSARASYDRGQWGVDVTYKDGQFANIAQNYVNKQVAIVLDNAVISAPKINSGITGNNVRISGNFSQGEAENLALALKYGSLPVRFDEKQQTIEDVSPTLGKDQLRAGIAAGAIGLVFVALYMLAFYRILGLVVWLGLGMTGMVMYTLVSWLGEWYGVTLTLSGVTGLIVSVGVTVDSYVVYFERLKDEVRTGKTVRSAVDPGWKKAWRTIVAADSVSLIGAGVLYALTIGSVKGFAYFLALSTIVDLVLAWAYMHPLVWMMSRRSKLVGMKGFGVAAGLDVAGRTSV